MYILFSSELIPFIVLIVLVLEFLLTKLNQDLKDLN